MSLPHFPGHTSGRSANFSVSGEIHVVTSQLPAGHFLPLIRDELNISTPAALNSSSRCPALPQHFLVNSFCLAGPTNWELRSRSRILLFSVLSSVFTAATLPSL